MTIHPFEDGNGRIARAIADMALARSERSPQRFYSMSAQTSRERSAYYALLERVQTGSMDITPWMEWFLACLGRAIDGAETALSTVLAKARFWQRVRDVPLNARQRQILNRLTLQLGYALSAGGRALPWSESRHSERKRASRIGVASHLDGFEGKLTTSKYALLAKCSHDTALRDIAALLAAGLLQQSTAGGRSTSYALGA